MTEVINVCFRNGSKNYYFDPHGMQIKAGQAVIVETAQGTEYAICTMENHAVDDSLIVRPLCAVLRLATDADLRAVAHHRQREEEAFELGERKIADHGLDMKLVNVSAGFDGNKLIFFFIADGRVDFRALVRDLAATLRCRIELRQIGVRDEAKMIGGMGICGRPFCCSQFLTSFLPVSIKMAKTQNLSLNPSKISGACGRLMCCLKYEQYAYEDAARRLPKMDSFVQTPDGTGDVKDRDLLRETVKVALDTDPDHLKTFRRREIILLRNGRGSREGISIPARPARFPEKRGEDASSVFSTCDGDEEEYGFDGLSDGNMSGGRHYPAKRKKNTGKPAEHLRNRSPGAQTPQPKQKREFYDGTDYGKRRKTKTWYRNNRRKPGGDV